MYREQDIDESIKILKKLVREIKNQDITLIQSLEILDQSKELIQTIEKDYFDKNLNVSQVRSKLGEMAEELPFTFE